MVSLGVAGNVSAMLASLKQCSSSKDLEKGKVLHSQAIECGLISNDYVCTSLINMYAKCGCLEEAFAVFRRSKRSRAAWTILIQGYVDSGQSQLALNLFDALDFVPDARLFVVALKACSHSRCPVRGKRVHSQILVNSCWDVFVENSLIDMYGKCGDMILARLVFNAMAHPDVISWTSLLHGYVENDQSQRALELFSQMQNTSGCVPNRGTFVAALMACGSFSFSESDRVKLVRTVKVLQDRALESRCCDTFVEAALIDAYARLGEIPRARLVFDRAKQCQASVVCWNSLLQGYVENGECHLALELFDDMQSVKFNVVPNARTFVSAISACGRLAGDTPTRADLLERLKGIHSQAVKSSCSDTFVETALIDSYARCNSMELARGVFDGMIHRNAASWTALIRGYTANGESEAALKLFHQMEPSLRDSRAYSAGLAACASLGELDRERTKTTATSKWLSEARSIHSEALKLNRTDSFLETTAVHAYAACGQMLLARKVFDGMADKKRVSWNILLQGYADNGEGEAALKLLASMDSHGASCDSITFVAALAACTSLELGMMIHAEIQSSGFENEALLATSLVSFYSRCGRMKTARESFDKIQSKDLCAWNTLIGGYSQQGEASQVFELLEEMKEHEISPDATTFSHVFSACSHAGLTRECHRYFNSMLHEHGIKPEISHCNCIVDLLGRSNCLEEAYKFIVAGMPVEPDLVTWTTMLAACSEWNNVHLANISFENIVKLDRFNGASYQLYDKMITTQTWR